MSLGLSTFWAHILVHLKKISDFDKILTALVVYGEIKLSCLFFKRMVIPVTGWSQISYVTIPGYIHVKVKTKNILQVIPFITLSWYIVII